MKRIVLILMCAAMFLALSAAGWCQTTPPSQTVDMKAEIQSENSISVTISKVVGTNPWQTVSAVDFGLLTYDATNKIFVAGCYYAVDVGVNSNAANWTVTHTINKNIVHETDTTKNLNDNINVTFVKQGTTPAELGKYSLTNSNNKAYTKAQVGAPNWLRIYYGIASGTGDATGVVPVTSEKPSGKYSGQVKLTLTAS